MKFKVRAVMADGSERNGYVELPIPETQIVQIPGFRSPIPNDIRNQLKTKITETFGRTKSISISNC